MDLASRREKAEAIAREAGAFALSHFRQLDELQIDHKGHQDFVSQADRDTETLVRDRLEAAFPDDAILGEEHAPKQGSSGFTWVIDPIDGTTNFINGIPAWTVVIAGVADGETRVGVIFDPCHDDMFAATAGQGAALNGAPLSNTDERDLRAGTVGVGYSNRVADRGIVSLVQTLVERGTMFARNASGALSLAYVAAGRFIGYAEEHMNAWDCLAGQLIAAEAGCVIEDQDADAMIAEGGRVVVGNRAVAEELIAICDRVFKP